MIKGVARKFGVHWRLVCQAVISALPPDRTYRQQSKPVLGAVEGFIDGILEDRRAPRKQRHTARRIYYRILAEMRNHMVAELTVRNYVPAPQAPTAAATAPVSDLASCGPDRHWHDRDKKVWGSVRRDSQSVFGGLSVARLMPTGRTPHYRRHGSHPGRWLCRPDQGSTIIPATVAGLPPVPTRLAIH
jgi:hypothetical protein